MKKILVFDDPEMVSFINSAVGDRCEIVWASNDEDLALRFRQEKPHIVLMTYDATDCNRFGKLLKEIRKESSKVPIVLMAGREILNHMPTLANGTIFRPFDKDVLEDTLKRYKIL